MDWRDKIDVELLEDWILVIEAMVLHFQLF
jgi:hypothetical protein